MWSEQAVELLYESAFAIEPPARVPLSEWTEEHFRLSSESSVSPGPISLFAFQREPLDAMSVHSQFQRVVCVWASQLSKSTMQLMFLAHTIKTDPGPALMVTANVEMAKSFSKDRVAPMVRDMPILRGLVGDPKARDSGSTVTHRRFIGGHLTLVGANSPAGLASRPIRYVLLDELDKYPQSAGSEGDPAALAVARSRTFPNRKIIMCSSPTTRGHSRIEQAWIESDQREFFVPCNRCDFFQVLMWERLEWPDGDTAAAAYRCRNCTKLIPHHLKARMVARGKWIAANPGAKVAGFRASEMLSPWRSWSELAEEWEAAQGNPERERAFKNTSLAEWWDDAEQAKLDTRALLARRETFGATLPAGVVALTVGVDAQNDRIELECIGWGAGEESWSIDYKVFPGDPLGPAPWAALDKYLATPWKHPVIGDVLIGACCVDSGAFTQAVYAYCRDRYNRRVFAIKGKAGAYPIWPKRPSQRGVCQVYIVGADTCKEVIMGRLRITEPGPGYCHFPRERTESYFDQLLSEFVSTTYRRGRPHREWVRRKGERAEALDARGYAMAALQALVTMGLRLDAEAERIAILASPNSTPEAAAAAAAGPAYKFKRSSLVN